METSENRKLDHRAVSEQNQTHAVARPELGFHDLAAGAPPEDLTMAIRCTECGATKGFSEETLAEYSIETLGLPNVTVLDAAIERRCKACREPGELEIPNLPGLIAAAAVARVMHRAKLDAEAIRFLQDALGLPARDLAERLGVRPETMSRWQHGKDPIGPSSEKLLRILTGIMLGKDAPAMEFSLTDAVEAKSHPFVKPLPIRLQLVRTPRRKTKSWELEAA